VLFNSKITAFFLLIFLVCTFSTKGQEKDSIRPKVGLVLSGGGAKGLAHIGVLKLLEKYQIPVDYITGTSMGSIVGALYSIGYSAAEIENISKSMRWNEIFDGSTQRSLISIEEKDQEGKFILEVPVKKGKPVIPTGLILGQKLEMELAKITWSVHGENDFSKFPIPFACIATDIETGEAVVINKGYLPDVIRASMAIPSVFSAVELNGKLLVDGGLARNFPVSDVRKMGADIVIGVDVASPLYKKDQLTSMLKIMEQAASFMNEQTNIKETKLVDILIKPNIDGYDASSFDGADSLIKNGEKAAILVEDQIIKLKEKLNQYKDTVKLKKNPPSLYSIFIHKVQFEGLNKVSKNLINSKLHIQDSSWVTLKDIEEAVARVYGSKYFEKVNFRIVQVNNETNLVIRVVEQPFSIFKTGINFNNYFNASLILNGTFRNILGEGSRLLLNAKLGYSPEFLADYSIFTNLKPSIGFRFQSEYYNVEETRYGISDSINLDIGNNTFINRIGFVSSLSNSTLFMLGAELSYKMYKPRNFNYTAYPDRTGIQVFSQIKVDNFDRNIYPNYGAFFNLYASYMFGELMKTNTDFDKSYWKFILNYEQYFPLSDKVTYRQAFNGALSFADDLFYDDQYFMGGEINFKNYIFPLTGYRFMQVTGKDIITASMGLRYEPWHGKFLLFDTNAGIAENQVEDIINPGKLYLGASVGIGVKTIIGPIEYKISTNNQDKRFNHWIQIGYYF
jgi:NTE family protein